MAALEPQIVILGGTWEILPNSLKIQLNELDNSERNVASIDHTIYIRAYHPNQTTISHEEYYNRIRNCLDPTGAGADPLYFGLCELLKGLFETNGSTESDHTQD